MLHTYLFAGLVSSDDVGSLIVGPMPKTERNIDVCFGKLMSNLDADGLDLVFQEILVTAIEDVAAVNALHVVVDAATEGVH